MKHTSHHYCRTTTQIKSGLPANWSLVAMFNDSLEISRVQEDTV